MAESENLSSPELQRKLQHRFSLFSGVDDPFADEKKRSNLIALDLYKQWQPKVIKSENPFDMALRLAIAGNIMDFGANHNFNIHETIEKVLHADFAIDHSSLLKQRISAAKSILYLGDNAGEIVFDKLFLEILMNHNVTYAVKGGPIINDVTIFDASEVEIDNAADVISNGYDAPSTVLEKSSQEFKDRFNSADLIISKGQGNLEGLISLNDKRIFFLLMVKCDVIAELLWAPVGSFVVYNSQFINAKI
ncbi:MAG: ARMT1-like domain-containing protein [Bacteroidetes bacterium]|nr:ARMT1-like domain-containing protein [Bacteroidota bacterium]